jgi:hypothetical protein
MIPPDVMLRQWVLTVPFELRLSLAVKQRSLVPPKTALGNALGYLHRQQHRLRLVRRILGYFRAQFRPRRPAHSSSRPTLACPVLAVDAPSVDGLLMNDPRGYPIEPAAWGAASAPHGFPRHRRQRRGHPSGCRGGRDAEGRLPRRIRARPVDTALAHGARQQPGMEPQRFFRELPVGRGERGGSPF